MIPIAVIGKSKRLIDKTIQSLLDEQNIRRPDILFIEKDGATLRIDTIRSLQPFISRTSTQPRAVVIFDFETAKDETQNTLLKTLEQDSDRVLFIIVCSDESILLPTISSRVKVLKIQSGTQNKKEIEKNDYKAMFIKTDKITMEKAIGYIDEIIKESRDVMKQSALVRPKQEAKKTVLYLKECIKTRSLLQFNNLNPQMAVDHLLLPTL
ncbi:hypothetical protein A2690_03695 [Candidatus Roizmanbacteria bacterium RIFCSPHIGHO2_01_FULL_39_12b]|uniref:DNA polymerase III delta N-terminal domain-containing protein n=1 Tax=Candidatus Roizmanbacteria bacterium RIFCSPHIGHO2_01_FULL_39_12b TaxID=1802030 RepID=A0A1F7GD28_9BACT|nr:MAG: hypothetical protein A2690_03695 [Candidatus Roizmanbacteria bacterium RIFCSPHIGHO2_01_FULL_39_12b]